MMTNLLAVVIMDPASIASWVVIGLVSAWLASMLMEPPSYGLPGELILGGVAATVGGFAFGLFGGTDPNFWMGLGVAFIAAVVLIGGARVVAGRREG